MKAIEPANYFDFAAATPMDSKVLQAMKPFFSDIFYNPSAIYQSSRELKQCLRQARGNIAKILGAKDSEVIFTAGATEANNLAIQGVMKKHPGCNIVVSAIEHDSVLKPAKLYKHKICKVLPSGIIDLDELEKLIDDQTVLVSVMLANNEIGTVQPIKKISALIETARSNRLKNGNKTPIYLHTDAAQAVNYLDIHISRLGVDLMSINGGKIYGPKQSGLLFIKVGVSLEPVIYGGGQEQGMRSGTENTPAIFGLCEALKLAEKYKKSEILRLQKLQKLMIHKLDSSGLQYQVNGSLKHRLPNNLSLTFAGSDNERLLILLDNAGYVVATGSACSASSDELSHVLKAIGMDETEVKSTLRITFGRQTTEKNIIGLVEAIKAIV